MAYHNDVASGAGAGYGDFYGFRRSHMTELDTAPHQQIFDNFIYMRPNHRRETNPTNDKAVTDEKDFSNKFSDIRGDSSRYYRHTPQPKGVPHPSVLPRQGKRLDTHDLEGFSPPNSNNLKFAVEVLQDTTPLRFAFNLEPRTLSYRPPSLVYEDIHEACIRYVKQHGCYSSRFVRQMDLTEIKNDSAFHYVLRTFCEKRETSISSDPYIGQLIDGSENGPPPAAWDIPVQPPALFQNGNVEIEIPHTAYVKHCPECTGTGRVLCTFCHGRGRKRCFCCLGSGRMKDGMCIACFGTGRSWCTQCSGSGKEKCENCDGRKNVRFFRTLIVTWLTFRDEFMSNMHNLPERYLKTVTGNRMLFEEDQMLTPILNSPDLSINEASASIMERHVESCQDMLILKQRHVINAIPLTKVFYKWREKYGEFYVYGHEKTVYFEQYPQRYCCCTCL